jgi:hypothetical protein
MCVITHFLSASDTRPFPINGKAVQERNSSFWKGLKGN